MQGAAFFGAIQPICVLLQCQQQALELGHGFCRSRRVYKFPSFEFRGTREKPAIQFHLLVVTGFSQG
jgi:hypothetical protein